MLQNTKALVIVPLLYHHANSNYDFLNASSSYMITLLPLTCETQYRSINLSPIHEKKTPTYFQPRPLTRSAPQSLNPTLKHTSPIKTTQILSLKVDLLTFVPFTNQLLISTDLILSHHWTLFSLAFIFRFFSFFWQLTLCHPRNVNHLLCSVPNLQHTNQMWYYPWICFLFALSFNQNKLNGCFLYFSIWTFWCR